GSPDIKKSVDKLRAILDKVSGQEVVKKLKFDGFSDEDLSLLEKPSYENIQKLALTHADAFLKTEETSDVLTAFAKDNGLEITDLCEKEAYKTQMPSFYNDLIED
ncbi:MAG: hypothetical protein ACPGEC_07025, partial [Flavobacteriales bacterium]